VADPDRQLAVVGHRRARGRRVGGEPDPAGAARGAIGRTRPVVRGTAAVRTTLDRPPERGRPPADV